MLAVLLAMVTFEIALAGAVENPPDDYLCYAAGSTKNKKLAPISGARVELQDRFGGLQRFVIRRLSTLCDPAGIDGDTVSHGNVHLIGVTLKKEKTAPKFVPFTQAVTDRFGTRTLALTGLATLLDVTARATGDYVPGRLHRRPDPECHRGQPLQVLHGRAAEGRAQVRAAGAADRRRRSLRRRSALRDQEGDEGLPAGRRRGRHAGRRRAATPCASVTR